MISAGVVPTGGWAVVEEVAEVEVDAVGAVVWVDVAVERVIVAIGGNDLGMVGSGEVSGVRWIAQRRELSSRSWSLPESGSGDFGGDSGCSGISGSRGSVGADDCTLCNDMSGRSAPRWGKELPALWRRVYHVPW